MRHSIRFSKLTATCALTTVLAAMAAPAQAQFATPLHFRNEGPGVLLTDRLVLHPAVAIQGSYDTNVLANDDIRKGAPFLMLLAALDLATRPEQRLGGKKPLLQFRLHGATGYREYLSDDDVLTKQRAVDVQGGLGVTLGEGRLISGYVRDDFTRTVYPQNTVTAPVAGEPGASTRDTNARDVNRLTVGGVVMPGGGRLTLSASYGLIADLFEQGSLKLNNRLFHQAMFEGKYKILPKTAVLLGVEQRFYDYLENFSPGARLAQIQSMPFRVYAGLAGLITSRLSTTIRLGYGNGFYDAGSSASLPLAKVELGYRITPTANASAGYEFSFDDSIFGNYFQDHKAYVGYDHLFYRRFVLGAKVEYINRTYKGLTGLPRTSAEMNLVSGSLGLDYHIQDWVYVGLGYDIQVQSIKDRLSLLPPDGAFIGLADFTRHIAYAHVGVTY